MAVSVLWNQEWSQIEELSAFGLEKRWGWGMVIGFNDLKNCQVEKELFCEILFVPSMNSYQASATSIMC